MKLKKAEPNVAKVIPFIPNKVVDTEESVIAEQLNVLPVDVATLISRSYDIERESSDYMIRNANLENMRFNESAGLTFLTEGGEVHHSPMSRYALGQLGVKLGVPVRYLEKCVKSGRIDLAQDNVNSWLEDYNKDVFLREYRGNIRGVLSSRYSVCDSHEILEVVNDTVDLFNYKVKGSFLNSERLHVRLVSKEMLPIDGEDLFTGLFIDSSDVGRSILTVCFGIYKQVCTNGLVVAKAGGVLFEQKHIGITSEEFHEGLSASLKSVDTLTSNALEWVNLARQSKVCGHSLKSLSQKDMEEFLLRVRNTTNLSEDGANKVVDLMRNKYGDSRWGFINSITEVAQDYTLERRLDLERIAGNLLVA